MIIWKRELILFVTNQMFLPNPSPVEQCSHTVVFKRALICPSEFHNSKFKSSKIDSHERKLFSLVLHLWAIASNSSSQTSSLISAAAGWPDSSPLATLSRAEVSVKIKVKIEVEVTIKVEVDVEVRVKMMVRVKIQVRVKVKVKDMIVLNKLFFGQSHFTFSGAHCVLQGWLPSPRLSSLEGLSFHCRHQRDPAQIFLGKNSLFDCVNFLY